MGEKLHIYSVSAGCWSAYDQIILLHEERYTGDQFLNICKEALNTIDQTDNYLDSTRQVADYLCTFKGFVRPTYLNCHLFDYSNEDELPVVTEANL